MEYRNEYLGSNKFHHKRSSIDCNVRQVGTVRQRNTLRVEHRVHHIHEYIQDHIHILVHRLHCMVVDCILVQDFKCIQKSSFTLRSVCLGADVFFFKI